MSTDAPKLIIKNVIATNVANTKNIVNSINIANAIKMVKTKKIVKKQKIVKTKKNANAIEIEKPIKCFAGKSNQCQIKHIDANNQKKVRNRFS